MDTAPTGWRYYSAAPNPACDYLWPELRRQIVAHDWPELRAFDLGCGNGTTANMLSKLGFDVTGVDISEGGIDIARIRDFIAARPTLWNEDIGED